MRRIDQTQHRAARAKLYLIFVEQLRGGRDSLAINQSTVEALQIRDRKLAVDPPNFGVPARDNRRGGIDYDLAFRIATQTNHLFIEGELARSR